MRTRTRILAWACLLWSGAVFSAALIYFLLNPLLEPFWFPIAFFAAFIPFNIGFGYIYGEKRRNRFNRKE